MTFFTSWLAPARRPLAGHFRRLRSSFDTLAEQVREAIARAIGRTVADAVTEAVDAALGPIAARNNGSQPTFSSRRPSPLWDDPEEARWRRQYEDDDPYRRDCPDDPDDRDPYADDPDDEPAETPQPRRGRLGRALAAGLQAAGWWLQHHRGRLSVLAAAGLGLVAGMATLVRDTAAGPAGVVAAALGLLALDGLVRTGSDLMSRAATPGTRSVPVARPAVPARESLAPAASGVGRTSR
jgi:hypothetical protein